MRISSIRIKGFKRFTDLTISGIDPETRLVALVGPNGSGKSSVFDALNQWHRLRAQINWNSDESYYVKGVGGRSNWRNMVDLQFHDIDPNAVEKGSMYFRTAHRNDPDFTIKEFRRLGAPYEEPNFHRAIDDDRSVAQNYQRLVQKTMAGVYSEANDGKTVKQLRTELIGKLRDSMRNVLEDLVLNDISDPLEDGTFTFQKGAVAAFRYKNLSGGEKAAFDLLLDVVLKLEYYPQALFFIEEPELHMHTELQGRLVHELYRLIPDGAQLWITTQSLGVMQMVRRIATQENDRAAVLDFSESDFDEPTTIHPVSADGIIWEKLLSVALGGLEDVLAPEIIVLCEGALNGVRRRDFDAEIYNTIFGRVRERITFVSGGSSTDLEASDHAGSQLLKHLLPNTVVRRLVDRDDRGADEIEELEGRGVLVTGRRHLESYLFDEEVLERLAKSVEKPEFAPRLAEAKREALARAHGRGKPADDVKAASGELYNSAKQLLALTACGNNAEAFMKVTLAPLVDEKTAVYKELKRDILDKIER